MKREREISNDIPYMWNLKGDDTNELIKQIQPHRFREQTYGCHGEGCVGRHREFGMDLYILLYLKSVTNKDLLSSTWNTAQCYVTAWMGEEFGGEWVHVYVGLSPSAVHLKLSQHCYSAIPQ